jgi:hypothetical protein
MTCACALVHRQVMTTAHDINFIAIIVLQPENRQPAPYDFLLLLGLDMISQITDGPLFSEFAGRFGLPRNDRRYSGCLLFL